MAQSSPESEPDPKFHFSGALDAVQQRLPPTFKADGPSFRADLTAGLTNAVVGIPSAMGHSLLAMVNPISGLLALAIGTPVAALFTSSVYMNVSTTSAISVAVGDVMRVFPANSQMGTLSTLVILVGILQVLAGVFQLGRLLRFVSNAVMTGFATGVAILIILGQLGDVTGFESPFRNKVLQAADLLLHLGQINWSILAVSLTTAAIIILVGYTRFARFAMIIALVVVTALVYFLNLQDVPLVEDVALMPRRLFEGITFEYSAAPYLFGSALAIVIIGLVQAASVSQSFPNPDGQYPNPSRDFAGQGIANAAVSIFHGLPVGGSTSSTIVNVAGGARSRWANILSGLFIAPLLLLFGGVINKVPMAVIAALLLVAAAQSIKYSKLHLVWVTGYAPRTAMMITLVSTLMLPLQYAIFVGVGVSALMMAVQQAEKVVVRSVVLQPRGMPIEVDVPATLPNRSVTILLVYGSLSFAAASVIEKMLPLPGDARRSAVILAMRFNTEIGSTFVTVLRRYVVALRKNDCELYLAGVQGDVMRQLEKTRVVELLGAEHVIPAEPELGMAVNKAIANAEAWIAAEPK